MSADSLEQAIEKTIADGKLTPKAIIPVDLFGLPADYDAIMQVAKKYNLLVLEDGAQGFGGSIDGKIVGSFGHAATTSFFPAKPLGCYGDGGAIFTDDDELAELLISIRIHGKGTEKYDNIRVGLNSRLDTLQAAILLPKLQAFKSYELDLRNKFANMYEFNLSSKYSTPKVPDRYISSWAQYTLLLDSEVERSELQAKLKSHDIPSMVYYPRPLHLQTAYRDLGYAVGAFPNAEAACARVLSLPMSPWLKSEELDAICRVLMG